MAEKKQIDFVITCPGPMNIVVTVDDNGVVDVQYIHNLSDEFAKALEKYGANRAGETWDKQGGPAKFHELVSFPFRLAGTEMQNHYDPIYVYWRANKDHPSPLYANALETALYQYRDLFIRPAGGGVQGYHINSLGLRKHYEDTGDLLSRDALLHLNFSSYVMHYYPIADTLNCTHALYAYSREFAYALNSMLDAERVGAQHKLRCDEAADLCLSHLRQMTDPTFNASWWKPECYNYQPFMAGLTLRALIQYWDRYRRPDIPAAIKQALDSLMENAFDPETKAFPYWLESTTPMSENPVCNIDRYAGLGYDGSTQPIPAPPLSLFIAPAFAWYARFDPTYLKHFEQIFIGSTAAGGVDGTLRPYHEKEHHQGYLWGPQGLDWRNQCLNPLPEATTYTLSRLDTNLTVRANHLAVQLVVSLPPNTGLKDPVTIVPIFNGRCIPATHTLTTDEPRAVFLLALDSDNDAIISTVNDSGLIDPDPLNVQVSGVAPFATGIEYTPHLPFPGPEQYGMFTAKLVPEGSVPPIEADIRAGMIRVSCYDGYAGGYYLPGAFFLSGDYPEAQFSYSPYSTQSRSLAFYDDMNWPEFNSTYTAGPIIDSPYRINENAIEILDYLYGGITIHDYRFYGVHRYRRINGNT